MVESQNATDNTVETQHQENLNKIQQEINEITGLDPNKDKINANLDTILDDEFKNFLSQNLETAQNLLTSIDTAISKLWNNPDPEIINQLTTVKAFLETIPGIKEAKTDSKTDNIDNTLSKENAKINVDDIHVTLRWKRKGKEGGELLSEQQKIVDELNWYTKLWEYLPENVQNILVLAANALKSESDPDTDISQEVLALEQALNMPESRTNPEIHNDADWRFWDQTYKALIDYIENSLKDSAEIQPEQIHVTLRWEWNKPEITDADREKAKWDITDKLNSYTLNWDTLTLDQKTILLMTKAALESTSDTTTAQSKEVFALEQKLVELGAMDEQATSGNNGVDWKFGTETYKIIIAYLGNPTKPQVLQENPQDHLSHVERDVTDQNLDNKTAATNLYTKYFNWNDSILKKIPEDTQDTTLLEIKQNLTKISALLKDPTTDNIKELQGLLHHLLEDPANPVNQAILDQYKTWEGRNWNLWEKINNSQSTAELLGIYLNNVSDQIDAITQAKTPDVTEINDDDKNTATESIETKVKDTTTSISFDKFKDDLPVTNPEINKRIWRIQELNNQLLEWKSINELTKDLSKINQLLKDKTDNQERNEWQKNLLNEQNNKLLTEINNDNIKKIIGEWGVTKENLADSKKTLLKQKQELEKDLKKQEKHQNNTTEIKQQITIISTAIENIQKIENNNQKIKDLWTENIKSLTDQKSEIEKQLKAKNKIKKQIIDNVAEINVLLNLEKDKLSDTDDAKKDNIDKYIDESIPQFVKWLDWEITPKEKDNNKENDTQVKESTKSNPEKPKQKRKPMTLSEFFNKLQWFEWQKWAWFQNIINFFNLLFWKTGSADQFKDKDYIDKNNQDVTNILLSLNSYKNVNWLEYIKIVRDEWDTGMVKDLQMKLWTPQNKLPISWKIDINTAKAIEKYVKNNGNWKDETPLGFDCIKWYKKIENAISTEATKWTLYQHADDYGDTSYIFIWKINIKAGNDGKTESSRCIAYNVDYDEANNKISPKEGKTLIQSPDEKACISEPDKKSITAWDNEWTLSDKPADTDS